MAASGCHHRSSGRGACVWGTFGKLESTTDVAAQSDESGTIICYVKESDIGSVQEGMEVRIGEDTFTISRIEREPITVTADLDEYLLHTGELKEGEWVYPVTLDGTAPAGIYPAEDRNGADLSDVVSDELR